MAASRPGIFISAVSKELASAREKIADVLRLLHFEPVVQTEFPNHTGVVKEMLEKELAPCAAVIQIVGHRYGWEVHGAANPTEVMSYTHYEAEYAHRNRIPIWYLVISDDYPVDHPNDEDDRKKLFQSAYRYRVQSTGHLYFPVADIKDVEIQVFRMQQSLDLLRPPRFQQIPLLASGNSSAEEPPTPTIPSTPTATELEKMMRSVLSDLVPALQQARQNTSPQDDAAAEDLLYARLAQILDKTPAEARVEIEALARKTRADTAEPLLERAKAAYALKDYPEAESLALAAAAQPGQDTIAALVLASQAATGQTQYPRALTHLHAAAALTNEERDILSWAEIQNEIGSLLYLDGQYHAQATLTHHVWQACEKAGHLEHPTTLRAHHLWASALDDQGKYVEAEAAHCAVLAIQERVLGTEHPATLASRNNLALALSSQGKYTEAEAEHRAVLTLFERVLGPDHPDTLSSRNNLAIALYSQGKYTEAEAEHRDVLTLLERILGTEHPATLTSRNNLALALYAQGKHTEAEAEHRAVLTLRQRVLCQEHPDTLNSRNNFANVLDDQGKHAEAETEYRAVLTLRERVLGPEHPDTLGSRSNLASALYSQGKHAEAETEYRAVLDLRERVLGPEHPDVFQSCYNLSLTLENLGRKAEALDYARRALAGWTKVLGADHPDSLLAKQLVADLEQK